MPSVETGSESISETFMTLCGLKCNGCKGASAASVEVVREKMLDKAGLQPDLSGTMKKSESWTTSG